MQKKRRRLVVAAIAGAFGAGVLAQPQEKVIRIVAKKFEYNPAEITLEKGVPVVLELTTEDITMGFLATEFKIDVEIVPGKAVRVPLRPEKTGTFDFSCDVFCGDGHEDMAGKIHVV